MTDKSRADELDALAERVEPATGPCRETDARIYAVMQGRDFPERPHEELQPDYDEDPTGSIKQMAVTRNGLLYTSMLAAAPRYTASLDAALTLAPKGWHVGMLTECGEHSEPQCCLTENDEPCRDAVGAGADMILSLVAAALRARATDERSREVGK